MKNILVAIDFDDNTEVLISKASEIAGAFKSRLWIVHIAAPDPSFMGYDNVDLKYVMENRANQLRTEHKKVQEYADNLRQKGFDAEGLLIQGPTAAMILEEAQKLNADLIVMEYREHGFLHKLFLGSTTPLIIKKSKIPVLMIPF